jgi:uncharacterized protein (UPF0261 family)
MAEVRADLIAKIQEASATLEKVLIDVEGVVPAGTPAGNALATATALLPIVVQSIITAVTLAHINLPPSHA